MDAVQNQIVCSAQIEDPAKYKFNFDYIVQGIAYNWLSIKKVDNLIRTSGLSKCDEALLRKDLNERINPLGRL